MHWMGVFACMDETGGRRPCDNNALIQVLVSSQVGLADEPVQF